jgi:hypothetical protein
MLYLSSIWPIRPIRLEKSLCLGVFVVCLLGDLRVLAVNEETEPSSPKAAPGQWAGGIFNVECSSCNEENRGGGVGSSVPFGP